MNYVPTLEEVLRDIRYRMQALMDPRFFDYESWICGQLDRIPQWIDCGY